MELNFISIIKKAVQSKHVEKLEVIQNLWSGYGDIARYAVDNSQIDGLRSIIVKHVRLPDQSNHPRGWNTDISHQRKIHSYQVETAWYHHFNSICDDQCRTPHCLALDQQGEEVIMVLEDLDDSGFSERRNSVSIEDINACLDWLANFHATFVGHHANGLWPSGTYWHLETRPDELLALSDLPLKNNATKIDARLNNIKYPSLVHGDAKLANFCFGKNTDGNVKVAAVDFQYVGGGCGMKDVAYFIGSCLYEDECEELETELLDYYFNALKKALVFHHPEINVEDMISEWRYLYYFAWADFHRFLKGWSPSHWKINSYSERITRKVLAELDN